MSIFGTTQSKFVYDHGGGGEVTVDLPYSKIVTSEPTTDYVEQKSQLDGEREFLPRGTHWVVELEVHIWKHTTAPTPSEKYSAIVAYKGLPVSLWLHSDGSPFYKSVGVDALFVLKEVTPKYATDTDYKDYLLLHFESADTILQA